MSVFRRYILTSKTNDKSDKIINKTQAFTAQNHVSNNAEPREKMKHQEGVHPYTASHRAIPILGPNETSRIIRWKPCQRAEKWPKPEWDEQKANRSEHNHSLRIRRTMVMKVHPIMSHKAPNRKKKKTRSGCNLPQMVYPIMIPWFPVFHRDPMGSQDLPTAGWLVRCSSTPLFVPPSDMGAKKLLTDT